MVQTSAVIIVGVVALGLSQTFAAPVVYDHYQYS